MSRPDIMKPEMKRKESAAEIRKKTPQERQTYLHGMVETIERKYPEMDPGAKRSIAFFLTEVTPIVRPSGDEKAMRDHLIGWSENHKHKSEMKQVVDNAGNLWVEIAATPGYEDQPGVILQSHMDMNCNPTAKQNPEISPEINPVIPVFKDNETKVGTEGHTLGADDGLGMATAVTLAEELFESSEPHGKVALLFTTDEEVGLTGAEGFSFDKDLLKGYKYYFNLDNEDTHEAVVGAAGGRNLYMRLPIEREQTAENRTYVTVDLSGLTGGHSGAEIHFGHLNAIKVMDRLLSGAVDSLDARLVTIDSGTTDSAIPQRGKAVVAILPGQEDLLQAACNQVREEIIVEDGQTKQELERSPLVKAKEKAKNKLAREFPEITVSPTSGNALTILPMTKDSSRAVLSLLADIPTGPLEIDEKYNIVKTSTNMGILETLSENGQDFIRVSSLTRSSAEESMINVNDAIARVAAAYGAEVEPGEKKFSAWEPDFNDPLIEIARQTHKEATGKDLEVIVLHAGLESHTIKLKMAEILGVDMPKDFHIISLGPTLDGPHSESEYFPIEEAGDFFPAMRLLFQAALRDEIGSEKEPSQRRTLAK